MLAKKSVSITTDGAGDGVGTLNIGSAYRRITRVRITEATTATADFTVVDADGKAIFTATGVDDSPAYDKYIVAAEGDVIDTGGEAAAADSAVSIAPIAKSPLTITVANGGDTKTHVFAVYSEGSFH
jgi:hypothetical protein